MNYIKTNYIILFSCLSPYNFWVCITSCFFLANRIIKMFLSSISRRLGSCECVPSSFCVVGSLQVWLYLIELNEHVTLIDLLFILAAMNRNTSKLAEIQTFFLQAKNISLMSQWGSTLMTKRFKWENQWR